MLYIILGWDEGDTGGGLDHMRFRGSLHSIEQAALRKLIAQYDYAQVAIVINGVISLIWDSRKHQGDRLDNVLNNKMME